MSIAECPECGARYSYMDNTGDFIHFCNVPEAYEFAQKEDIIVTQTSISEFGGTVTGKGPAEIMNQGHENNLFGTDAWLQGEKNSERNIRGNPVNRFRSRDRYTYIDHTKVGGEE